jgi:hypothetical protein
MAWSKQNVDGTADRMMVVVVVCMIYMTHMWMDMIREYLGTRNVEMWNMSEICGGTEAHIHCRIRIVAQTRHTLQKRTFYDYVVV